jgi:polyisoprenoid-binding protein YceI
MKRVLVVGLVVVAALVGGAAWWMSRADSPPPLSVDDVAAADDGERSTGSDGEALLDGEWVVVRGEDTVAGLRIEEERAGGLANHTAVGRTDQVEGSLVVADGEVTEGTFLVDLAAIEFTDDPGLPVADRSEYLRTRALETDEFPEARFAIAEPVALPALAGGAARGVEVPGVLELRGVEQPVTIRVDVRRDGDEVVLGTSEPVTVRLADHGIEAPAIPGLAKVADEGEFEFVVVLGRA